MKTFAQRNTLRWQAVKAVADAEVVNTSALGLGDLEAVPSLSIAYQLTGKRAYAQQAIRILLAVAVPSDTLSSGSYWNYRWAIPDVTFGYDWCFSQMTVAQRQQVATWLMDRTDSVWPETNPAQIGGWAVDDPANNYYYGFLSTWAAALAVYGDNTDTGVGAVSGYNRPAYHLKLALSRYNNEVLPFANSWGVGGVFAESTNYDSTWQLSQILDAHNTATGQDLINAPGFNFLHDSIYWRIYQTVPTNDLDYNLGDQSRVAMGTIWDEDRWRAFGPMDTVDDPVVKAYAKNWLDTLQFSMSTYYGVVDWEFLYYDEDATATDYTKVLPPYYFASGPGMLIRRSDWSPTATYWGIWAGQNYEGHQFADVNGFLIYKGTSWLVGNDSMWSYGGSLEDTIYHNNLTFGGIGQSYQYPNANWPNPGGVTLHSENTADYTYFAGWGTQAYVQGRTWGGTALASDYVRKVAYIAPNTFFIYDRATLLNPALPKEWHLHSQKPMTINGRSYSFNNGQYKLVGQSLLPATGVTVGQTPVYGNGTTTPSSYCLNVVTNNNKATDYMLNVLQVAPIGQATVTPAQSLTADTGNAAGSICDNWVVMFGNSDLVTTSVGYTINTNIVTQHLVTDLYPSTSYQVTMTNLATTAPTASTQTTTQTTTSQGSLRLSVPAGKYRIVLTPPANAKGTNPDPAFIGSASFIGTDAKTQGTWRGVYGKVGYNIIGNATSYPSYAQINVTGQTNWTWITSTQDIRALQKAPPATDRILSCWYSDSAFNIDVNLTDGQAHQVGLYCIDGDRQNRQERIDVTDYSSGMLLDSRTVSSFDNGVYLLWTLKGHIVITLTTLSGPNAVVSGLFFN